MNVTPQQFEKAFAEFQAFGPRRRIPIEERWREILPEVESSEFSMLKIQCKEIEESALNLAERVRDKQMSDDVARKQLVERYPFLTRERVEHTWSQAMYFSYK
jgi:hypothetical protein